MNDDSFRPTAGWENLKLRARLLSRARTFFDQRDFLEVETPLLSRDTVVDRHLHPIRVELSTQGFGRGLRNNADRDAREDERIGWLQTSPELAMKRMLAAGSGPIYQVTRSFRAGEIGPLHNPEFTIVEWYVPGQKMDDAIGLLSEFAETLLGRGPAEQISYREAFKQHVGLDPHQASVDQLMETALRLGVVVPESMSVEDRDLWLDMLLVDQVQPYLGVDRPAVLYDYPASQAALAQVEEVQYRDDKNRIPVARRFELYCDGIELANGYQELTDPDELRQRNHEANRLRREDGNNVLPEKSRLLDAMDHGLPESSGVALGLDRVVMLAAGAKSIDQVIAFPFDIA